MSERIRELMGYLISMAALHDDKAAKLFADELELLLQKREAEVAALKVEIGDLKTQLKGPDEFATWNDAAVAERVRRVKAEATIERVRNVEVRQQEPDSARVVFYDVLLAALKEQQP